MSINQPGTVLREPNHVSIDHAINQLERAIDRLSDLRVKICEENKPTTPNDCKEPPYSSPTLLSFLGGGRERIAKSSERIELLVAEISGMLF